jgi:hypothetical protein
VSTPHVELPPQTHVDREAAPLVARLWTGILVPPVAYLGALSGAYFFVEADCRRSSLAALLFFPVVALLLTGIAALGAARARRDVERAGHPITDLTIRRATFLSLVGLMMSAFCALLALGTAFPMFVLRPCG